MKRKPGRRPAKGWSIELPMPTNMPKSSAEHQAWMDAARLRLDAASLEHLPGCISLQLRAGVTDAQHLSDAIARIVALLATRRIIDAPEAVVDIDARFDRVVEPQRAMLHVRQTVPPSWRTTLGHRQKLRSRLLERWRRVREEKAAKQEGRAA